MPKLQVDTGMGDMLEVDAPEGADLGQAALTAVRHYKATRAQSQQAAAPDTGISLPAAGAADTLTQTPARQAQQAALAQSSLSQATASNIPTMQTQVPQQAPRFDLAKAKAQIRAGFANGLPVQNSYQPPTDPIERQRQQMETSLDTPTSYADAANAMNSASIRDQRAAKIRRGGGDILDVLTNAPYDVMAATKNFYEGAINFPAQVGQGITSIARNRVAGGDVGSDIDTVSQLNPLSRFIPAAKQAISGDVTGALGTASNEALAAPASTALDLYITHGMFEHGIGKAREGIGRVQEAIDAKGATALEGFKPTARNTAGIIDRTYLNQPKGGMFNRSGTTPETTTAFPTGDRVARTRGILSDNTLPQVPGGRFRPAAGEVPDPLMPQPGGNGAVPSDWLGTAPITVPPDYTRPISLGVNHSRNGVFSAGAVSGVNIEPPHFNDAASGTEGSAAGRFSNESGIPGRPLNPQQVRSRGAESLGTVRDPALQDMQIGGGPDIYAEATRAPELPEVNVPSERLPAPGEDAGHLLPVSPRLPVASDPRSNIQRALSPQAISFRVKGDIPKMNPHLVAGVDSIAQRMGMEIGVSTAISGHSKMTTTGNISRHVSGNAMDISSINGVTFKSDPREFTRLGNQLVEGLKASGYQFGEGAGHDQAYLWQTRIGGNHFNHIHVSSTNRLGLPTERGRVKIAGTSALDVMDPNRPGTPIPPEGLAGAEAGNAGPENPVITSLVKKHGTTPLSDVDQRDAGYWLLPDGRMTGKFDYHDDSAWDALKANGLHRPNATGIPTATDDLIRETGAVRVRVDPTGWHGGDLNVEAQGAMTSAQARAIRKLADRTEGSFVFGLRDEAAEPSPWYNGKGVDDFMRRVNISDPRGPAGDAGPSGAGLLMPSQRAKGPQADHSLISGAEAYNKKNGLPPIGEQQYEQVDPRASKIADAYESMQHTPESPAVQRAYVAMKSDIGKQWNHATKDMGITFEPWNQDGQPYANSKEMVADVRDNKHLYFFQGGDMPADHPLAEVDPKTGLTYNDMLRAVHDLFGHAAGGYEFGPRGEENAWIKHSKMFSRDAIPAVTTETKGQNSWVNFGPHLRDADGNIPQKGQPGFVPATERPFADQKAGLLPPEFYSRDGSYKGDLAGAGGGSTTPIPAGIRVERAYHEPSPRNADPDTLAKLLEPGNKIQLIPADRTDVGWYRPRDPNSGIRVPLHGGWQFPSLEGWNGKAAWASEPGANAYGPNTNMGPEGSVNRNVAAGGRLGIVAVGAKGQAISNIDFAKAYLAETAHDVTTGKNTLQNVNAGIRDAVQFLREFATAHGKKDPFKGNVVDDAKSLDAVLPQMSFQARAAFFSRLGGDAAKRAYGMIDHREVMKGVEDPRFDKLDGAGHAVAAVHFAKDSKAVYSDDVGLPRHPSYRKAFPGDVGGPFPHFIPFRELFNKGLEDKADAQAWRSASMNGALSDANPDAMIRHGFTEDWLDEVRKKQDAGTAIEGPVGYRGDAQGASGLGQGESPGEPGLAGQPGGRGAAGPAGAQGVSGAGLGTPPKLPGREDWAPGGSKLAEYDKAIADAKAEADAVRAAAKGQKPGRFTAKLDPNDPYKNLVRTKAQLLAGAERMKDWKTWYETYHDVLRKALGEDTGVFLKIMGATSQANSVAGNVTQAIKAYGQYLRGEPFTGHMGPVAGNLESIRNSENARGGKIARFIQAVEGDPNAVALDRHVSNILFGTKRPTPRMVEHGQRVVAELAKANGWQPRQVQAALWALNQVEEGFIPNSYDKFIEKRKAEIAALRAENPGGAAGSVRPGADSGEAAKGQEAKATDNLPVQAEGDGRQPGVGDLKAAAAAGKRDKVISVLKDEYGEIPHGKVPSSGSYYLTPDGKFSGEDTSNHGDIATDVLTKTGDKAVDSGDYEELTKRMMDQADSLRVSVIDKRVSVESAGTPNPAQVKAASLLAERMTGTLDYNIGDGKYTGSTIDGFERDANRLLETEPVKPKKDLAGAEPGNTSELPAGIRVEKTSPIGLTQEQQWDAAIEAKDNGGRWDEDKFLSNLRQSMPDVTPEQARTLYDQTKAGAPGDPVVRARNAEAELKTKAAVEASKDGPTPQALTSKLLEMFPPVKLADVNFRRGSHYITEDGIITASTFSTHAAKANDVVRALGMDPAKLPVPAIDMLIRAGNIRVNTDYGRVGVQARSALTFAQIRKIKAMNEVAPSPDGFVYELEDPATGGRLYIGNSMREFDRDVASYRNDLAGSRNTLNAGVNFGMLSDPKMRESVKREALEIINAPRSLQSSLDLSAPLRQGLILTLTDPVAAANATRAMLQSFMGPDATAKYGAAIKAVKTSPSAKMAEEAGLYLASKAGEKMGAREEAYMSKIVGKLWHVKFSEQAYVAYLDTLRQSVFDHHVAELRRNGVDLRTTEGKENLQSVAHFINVATGRGDLPKFLEDSGPLLNGVFYSPRLVASRVQILNPMEYAKMPVAARKIAMRKMAQFVATSTATLALAKMAGATVSTDPESPDFLKIRFGHTRYDILGGIAQPTRFGIRFAYHLWRNFEGKKNRESRQPINLATNFARSKLSPTASYGFDAMKGKDFSGKRFKPIGGVIDRVVPMIGHDAYDAFKDEGVVGVAKQIPGYFGVGVSSYK